MSAPRLRVSRTQQGEFVLARAAGHLDLRSYPDLRDGLLKSAVDADALIADISELEIDDPALTSVFALVALRIGDWPAVPFAVVSERPDHRALLRNRTVDRLTRVEASVDGAAAVLDRPPQLRVQREIPRSTGAAVRARESVREICEDWAVPGLIDDAKSVVTELVENALQHTDSTPRLRLELRRNRCTVAVTDDDPRPAVLRERLANAGGGLGLKLVAQLSRVWGCSPRWTGGKVVWAVLEVSGTSG
ncbi:ATP-binding protein [Amycolatopsis jiangsuensis]|uniref:Signal transduction histidine kinase n=1 Tax=Amycolatopsis jiangsuensis TaxID=1181879 RepID=A0A840J747_9PSEU|nr:ATP-binding protein [Amycolatopsis jiangsuensis]MBB4689218.1 signal transduction histidine kinase [Amycolatopsis jiangsuensis]